jgi:hypothetical protein
MRLLTWVAVGVLTVCLANGAHAQTGGAPYNTTSPSTNPLGVPDPNAPPPSPNDVTPGVPATAAPEAPSNTSVTVVPPGATEPSTPAEPSTAPAGAATTPGGAATVLPPAAPTSEVQPPATGPQPPINVNPAPPSPPPLRRTIDDNTAATTGASVAKVPVEPLPPLDASRGEDHRSGMYQPGLSRFGWAVVVGGGYEDFTNGSMRGLTSGGGAWDARVVGGTRSYVGFEAAYVGSARDVTALGAGRSTLVANGFEGTLRLNVPVVRQRALYEPYGFIGLGYSRYSITNFNAALTSDFASADGVMTMPFGAGFAWGYAGFIADARFTYTPTYFNSLLQTGNGSGALNHWGAGANVGFTF